MNYENERRAVLIFDWDDTICPSSFVDQWKIEHFEDLPEQVSLEIVETLSVSLASVQYQVVSLSSRYFALSLFKHIFRC